MTSSGPTADSDQTSLSLDSWSSALSSKPWEELPMYPHASSGGEISAEEADRTEFKSLPGCVT